MSIFGTILSKVFGSNHPAAQQSSGQTGSASEAPPTAPATPAPPPDNAPSQSSQGSTTPTAGTQTVDVAEVLDGMAAKAGQKLDWRHSIVDLMKLVGMDSSLSARKELANELQYTGDTNDSASMNIWLHKQVMTKFAENGGKLPDDLKH